MTVSGVGSGLISIIEGLLILHLIDVFSIATHCVLSRVLNASSQPLSQKMIELQLQREESQETLIVILTSESETAVNTSYII